MGFILPLTARHPRIKRKYSIAAAALLCYGVGTASRLEFTSPWRINKQ